MEALSERYGWTPDEIRSIKLKDLEYYITIIQQKNLIQQENGK